MTNGYANRAESTFAGRRDVKSPATLAERQIVSARGTVRGFKNRVRAGIATFIEPFSEKRNYHVLEKDKIVIYTTSMSVVRHTHEKCKVVRNILQTNMVRYEERDLYMSKENQKELTERVNSNDIRIPQVFADGELIGGAAELEKLNESGELRNILHNYPKVIVTSNCRKCGGYRFIPCIICHGSKKSVHRNHFTEEFCALRCMQCDDNGLQRCDLCREQQE
ncbi:hypothetical protein LOTGIDRAFT_137010 [Lottia gigantea]|uniref:Glutaredoxin domain-containing protein n=1 Tax=Lottia gigantea TaxID=225164 RepID=V4B0L1_LOTGI|nr:hypothetical protein LOTGIDRAFT_137010 [Lottia gigantea]ESP03673.1 hypothetical protein LOTGIDRAFT_137010 [Lottia gigantea]